MGERVERGLNREKQLYFGSYSGGRKDVQLAAQFLCPILHIIQSIATASQISIKPFPLVFYQQAKMAVVHIYRNIDRIAAAVLDALLSASLKTR
jgi:hypothetical protein